MDDKRIEDLLRNTLRATPPEEMRARTLRTARQELNKRQAKPQILGMSRWQAALAIGAVMIAILTNMSDTARQERIGEMVCGPSEIVTPVYIAQVASSQAWKDRQAELVNMLREVEGTDPL